MRKLIAQESRFEISHLVDEHPQQTAFYMHAHEHYELLLFISGDVTYLVEGEMYTPKPYDILIFNIAETHKVIINSDTLYERTVIKMDKDLLGESDDSGALFLPFSSRANGQGNVITPTRFPSPLWKLCLANLQTENKSALYYLSNLINLLSEIGNSTHTGNDTPPPETVALRIIRYVNNHITDRLVPEDIAKRFFISKTTLYTLFRQSTGTTFHDYVTAKRLIIARELLRLGRKPTDVAAHCGFTEYSTFFRLYKRQYRESPKTIRSQHKPEQI